MKNDNIKKPEVVVEDVLTTTADALVIIPGISLGGEDLSAQIMKIAGVAQMSACEQGSAIMLPVRGMNVRQMIVGRAAALDDNESDGMAVYAVTMKTCLDLARSASTETIAFASLPTDRYDSRLFSIITSEWRAIIDSQRSFGSPSLVRIICPNDVCSITIGTLRRRQNR